MPAVKSEGDGVRPGGPRDNRSARRYELERDGQIATLTYARAPGRKIVLIHTEVPEALRGQGLANELAAFALAAAREAGEKVEVRCPFVQAYLRKHPEAGGPPQA